MNEIISIIVSCFMFYNTAATTQLNIQHEEQVKIHKEELVQEYEKKMAAIELEQSLLKLHNVDAENVVVVGNSLVTGLDMVDDEYQYIAKVGISFNGFDGNGFYDKIAASSANTIVVQMGTNELGWSVENFENAYRTFIERTQELKPDAELILTTIVPLSQNRDNTDSKFNNTHARAFDEIIYKLAEEYNLLVIDNHELFGEVLDSNKTGDGIHLSGGTYREWSDFLKEKLRELT